MNFKEALARLRVTHEFNVVMDEAEKQKPMIFPMDPSKSLDEQSAKAMYQSGMLRGFELLYQFLRGHNG